MSAAVSTHRPDVSSPNALPELSAVGVPSTTNCPSTSPHARPLRTSCVQWVPSDARQAEETEQRLLHGLVFSQRRIHGMNTISSLGYNNPTNGKQHTVVLLHGFAGGLGCWAQNWAFLSERFNVHAIDLPGFARSDRTKRTFRTTDDAMAYFYTSLRNWLQEAGIPTGQPVTLVGHSFGGYVATQYVLRALQAETTEPDSAIPVVEHVVLADPWGVPPASERKLAFKHRMLLRAFYAFSPLAIVRLAGPWGPNLLPRVRPDFADRWNNHLPDPMVFYDYSYHCNAQVPATGEHAFKACCEGPAFAKAPLVDVVPAALRAAKEAAERQDAERIRRNPSTHLTMTFLYGENTWMDTGAGHALARRVAAERLVQKVACATIAGAGHQLNTDNVDDFNAKLEAAILGRLQAFE